MFRYGLTIFLSAFLLFQIQPMIARFILPWFGGTAAVWTTCMMFFQTVLLLGYLYAHILRRNFRPVVAWSIHLVVLAIAAALVSVVPTEGLKPTGQEHLTLGILTVLAATIGLPFFVLSTTGPLIQAWQSTSHQGQSPYRLYGLSNLGSMLALLTYPFLIESWFPLADQAMIWTIGFFVFTVCCCWSGWQALKYSQWREKSESDSQSDSAPSMVRVFSWTVLAMTASIVLLATTNLLCQEVASFPFLWILPLALYLASFIICFDRPALYRRIVFTPLLIVGAIASIVLVHLDVLAGLGLQIAGLATVCFAASMTCHGELERLKPASKFLTSFYLWVSVGGALGGVFVCIAAPNWFDGFYEFHIGLGISLIVALFAIMVANYSDAGDGQSSTNKIGGWMLALGLFVALGVVACSLVYFLDPSYHEGVVYRGRNEYGLSSVLDDGTTRRFINGRIGHGAQSLDPEQAANSVGYYVEGSGVAVAFQSLRNSRSGGSLKSGVVGLGAGAMASWLASEDEMIFYEINPMVERIARDHFDFLSQSKGDCQVVLGDGRIQLQRELEQTGSHGFDLLFMDAFASDSIPVHLLTAESFDLYFDHLKPDGILIIHITNRFIDLRPVLLQHAKDRNIDPILIDCQPEGQSVKTRWVLFTRNRDVLQSSFVADAKRDWPDDLEPLGWTDDFGSVVGLLDWSAGVDWEKIKSSRAQPADDSEKSKQKSKP